MVKLSGMRLLTGLLSAIVIAALFLGAATSRAFALSDPPPVCTTAYPASQFSLDTNWPSSSFWGVTYSGLHINIQGLPDAKYKITCFAIWLGAGVTHLDLDSNTDLSLTSVTNGRGTLNWNNSNIDCFQVPSGSSGENTNEATGYVKIEPVSNPDSACTIASYSLKKATTGAISCSSSNFTFTDKDGNSGCFEVSTDTTSSQINWSIDNLKYSTGDLVNRNMILRFAGADVSTQNITVVDGKASGTVKAGKDVVNLTATLDDSDNMSFGNASYCTSSGVALHIANSCTEADKKATPTPTPSSSNAPFSLCGQVAKVDQEACLKCYYGNTSSVPTEDSVPESSTKLWTAFGCVSVGTPQSIVADILRIGMAMAGGFVLLNILFGAFMLSTSSGDPKRVQEAQEMISSAVIGLLFVIFSVIILQFIGVSILRIPGFGG